MIKLSDYHRIVFFTGAGMSAESGVPTYRGAGGIWKDYDFKRYACAEAFDRNPEEVWEFHNYRRDLVAKCEPNEGHRFIASLRDVTVVTQNIDGLHQLAGSKDIVELHGSLWRTRCDRCGTKETKREAPLMVTRCECGRFKRPDIVWFGDALLPHVINAAIEALENCDLLVSIGTSAVVFPAADLPRIAKERGAALVEINPEETPMSGLYEHHLRTTASEGLKQLHSP